VHIGATVVTHWKNYEFYNRDVVTFAPRTLAPDMLSMWPPTELAEGYYYEAIRENFIISDGTRNLNVHYVNPLAHVEGMLIAYLPKEKLLFEADLYDTNQPARGKMTADHRSFYNAVTRLGLDVDRIVPVHGAPAPWSDFAAAVKSASLGLRRHVSGEHVFMLRVADGKDRLGPGANHEFQTGDAR
jgi:hypothetical protein